MSLACVARQQPAIFITVDIAFIVGCVGGNEICWLLLRCMAGWKRHSVETPSRPPTALAPIRAVAGVK